MIYSGIDLHKTNMVITIDSNGAEPARAKLPCRKAEVSAYFSRFTRSHQAVVNRRVAGLALGSAFRERRGTDPGACLAAEGNQLREVKTGKVDAKTLAG